MHQRPLPLMRRQQPLPLEIFLDLHQRPLLLVRRQQPLPLLAIFHWSNFSTGPPRRKSHHVVQIIQPSVIPLREWSLVRVPHIWLAHFQFQNIGALDLLLNDEFGGTSPNHFWQSLHLWPPTARSSSCAVSRDPAPCCSCTAASSLLNLAAKSLNLVSSFPFSLLSSSDFSSTSRPSLT